LSKSARKLQFKAELSFFSRRLGVLYRHECRQAIELTLQFGWRVFVEMPIGEAK
jgi:hypothetical protein